MKRATIKFLVPTIVIFAMAASAVASTTITSHKYFELSGKVLKVDQKNRTLLVADMFSDKLYIVKVPEGSIFKITFGINARYNEPTLRDVFKGDRIKANCTRSNEDHLARLEDGRTAIVMVAATN